MSCSALLQEAAIFLYRGSEMLVSLLLRGCAIDFLWPFWPDSLGASCACRFATSTCSLAVLGRVCCWRAFLVSSDYAVQRFGQTTRQRRAVPSDELLPIKIP